MPSISVDQIWTTQNVRTFLQNGGPRPTASLAYAGLEGQYGVIEGVASPQSGGVSPVNVYDPRSRKRYAQAAEAVDPPDFPTWDLRLYEKMGPLPKQFGRRGCVYNAYSLTGKCNDPADFNRGWGGGGYVLVFSRGQVTDVDLGTRSSFDSDEPLEATLSTTGRAVYGVGSLGFGEKAAAQANREVVDVVYGTQVQCSDCGEPNDGTKYAYAIAKSSGGGSPGLPSIVLYTVDSGATWTALDIDGIGASADATAIDIVGDKLVVLVTSESAYYYASINSLTGIPGTFTKVTTGFTTQPNDLFVSSAREVWFCGQTGYIYFTDDITAGVVTKDAGAATTVSLKRIHGDGAQTIIAVGASGDVIRSINRGVSFTATTYNPSADTNTAVWVFDQYFFYVGDDAGNVFYTVDGGESWTEIVITGSTAVNDIVFATPEVGYIAYEVTSPAQRGYLLTTFCGGSLWTTESPRIVQLPTVDSINRIALPTTVVDPQTDANNILCACLADDGSDGLVLQGAASQV